MQIRPYRDEDWPSLWDCLEPVVRAGETYAIAPDIAQAELRTSWTGAGHEVFVAQEQDSAQLLGTYYLKANHGGPGSHVANCGYVVAEAARGQGLATRLCQHSQARAIERGFLAMQFNLVASSNEGAVRLWQRLGFRIVGTLPGAFRHPVLGLVDAFVMHKHLGEAPEES